MNWSKEIFSLFEQYEKKTDIKENKSNVKYLRVNQIFFHQLIEHKNTYFNWTKGDFFLNSWFFSYYFSYK